MTTVAEYRQYAQECVESARTATTDAVRDQFLELATLWMTAAERLERSTKPPHKLDGHAPLKSAL